MLQDAQDQQDKVQQAQLDLLVQQGLAALAQLGLEDQLVYKVYKVLQVSKVLKELQGKKVKLVQQDH